MDGSASIIKKKTYGAQKIAQDLDKLTLFIHKFCGGKSSIKHFWQFISNIASSTVSDFLQKHSNLPQKKSMFNSRRDLELPFYFIKKNCANEVLVQEWGWCLKEYQRHVK